MFVRICESIEEQRAGVSCYLLLMFILPEQPGMSLLVCWGAILGAILGSILPRLFLSPLHFTEVSLAPFLHSLSTFSSSCLPIYFSLLSVRLQSGIYWLHGHRCSWVSGQHTEKQSQVWDCHQRLHWWQCAIWIETCTDYQNICHFLKHHVMHSVKCKKCNFMFV